jgi:hypothetical protein
LHLPAIMTWNLQLSRWDSSHYTDWVTIIYNLSKIKPDTRTED